MIDDPTPGSAFASSVESSMFELLFKYPQAVFAKGKLVLLSPWPLWLMFVLLILAAGGLYWHMRQRQVVLSTLRSTLIWLAQTALIAIVLFMLWHPAISVARVAAAAERRSRFDRRCCIWGPWFFFGCCPIRTQWDSGHSFACWSGMFLP